MTNFVERNDSGFATQSIQETVIKHLPVDYRQILFNARMKNVTVYSLELIELSSMNKVSLVRFPPVVTLD